MKKIYETPADAIMASIEYNTIAWCESTAENRDELELTADDWGGDYTYIDFWGTNDDGYEWRVHVEPAPKLEEADE